MGRIEQRLASLHQRGEKALALFITGGYPDLHSAVSLVPILEEGGADIIEIGMPFSDPLADGPVIQESSSAALANGTHLQSILADVAEIRSRSEIPIVLMGYLNPILCFGAKNFFKVAGGYGADGIILPELPLEEAGRFAVECAASGLSQVLLVTPTSSPERIRAIDEAARGFVYCVSTTGVTGSAAKKSPREYIGNVHRLVRHNPLLVGFGISDPVTARELAGDADGIIIGSALIRKIKESADPAGLRAWVRQFKNAIAQE
ncbi:tryptophan synthase subunit alpha [bacterium]|nr:MAG: tryptophan synthase subunit alpha [bacterium]